MIFFFYIKKTPSNALQQVSCQERIRKSYIQRERARRRGRCSGDCESAPSRAAPNAPTRCVARQGATSRAHDAALTNTRRGCAPRSSIRILRSAVSAVCEPDNVAHPESRTLRLAIRQTRVRSRCRCRCRSTCPSRTDQSTRRRRPVFARAFSQRNHESKAAMCDARFRCFGGRAAAVWRAIARADARSS